MNILIGFYNEILYKPLFNILIIITDIIPTHDLGLAIIVLTLIIRFLLYPLSQKAIKSQKAMAKIQPEMKEIQKKIKDKEAQVKAIMDLYKKYQVNPFSGFVPLLIQIPILLALYQVFVSGIKNIPDNILYSFVSKPEFLNHLFLGFLDISKPNIYLAISVGIFTFLQVKTSIPKNKNIQNKEMDFAQALNFQMTYFMPVMTFFIATVLPAALALYWIVVTLFQVVQQYLTKGSFEHK